MGLAPYDNAVQAIGNAFGKMFDSLKTNKEHQLETSVIKENGRQDKALKAANEAFDLVLRNVECLPGDVQKSFYKQKKIFDKNIV